MIIILSSNNNVQNSSKAFHVTLASPKMYQDGKYEKIIDLDEGTYRFHFVPSGDSPKILSIIIDGDEFHFSEDFKLIGTPHEAGIAEYYTWDYNGEKKIIISNKTELKITINPNGDILGPVSVDIIKE